MSYAAVSSRLLPDAINEFSLKYPDCQIQVIDGPYQDLLHHLRIGDIDVLIGALRFPPPSADICQETLFESPNAILVRPDHPLLVKETITIDDLSAASWVVAPRPTPARTMFENIFQDQGSPTPTRIVEASSQMLVRELLLGSDRLTMLSKHQTTRELIEGHFKILPFTGNHQSRPIGLKIRNNWHATAMQDYFIKLLRDKGLKLQ